MFQSPRLDGSGFAFAYDTDGIRVAKSVNGAVTNFLIDKVQAYPQVVEERDGSGALVASYTYGNDLVSQQRGASTAYYAYDGLGSTRALTDSAGVVTDAYTYDAFGTTVSETGTTENAYRFTGEQQDAETGLQYLRARYYSPATGRFLTLDSWSGSDRSPLSLNKYLYADGNPVIGIDPTGRFTIIQSMVTVSVIGILSAIAQPSWGWRGAPCSSWHFAAAAD
jgi:RHS repeat-associated protein